MGRNPKPPNLTTWQGRCGAHLRKLREKRFRTQDEFVAALRKNGLETVTKSTVSGWETGYMTPPIAKFHVIAQSLRVPIRSLIPPE